MSRKDEGNRELDTCVDANAGKEPGYPRIVQEVEKKVRRASAEVVFIAVVKS